MAEPTQIVFSHKEVAEALITQQGIHDGIWGLYIKFGIKGMNMGTSDGDLLPTAVVPILQIGLQKFEKVNNISVDAAQISKKQPGEPPSGSQVDEARHRRRAKK